MISPSPRSARLRADLTLLLVAFIWGGAFVVQRMMAVQMSVYLFNGLRFLLGALALLPFTLISKPDPPWQGRASLPGTILAGVLLFSGGTLQQFGLRFTTAGNAGFITGLYVVLVPLVLALAGRRRPASTAWIASLMAAAGLFLLSTGGSYQLAAGDLLELAGAGTWALHVITIGWLARRADALRISIIQNTICGLLSLLFFFLFEGGLSAWAGVVWWAVVLTGILSIAVGYTLQVVGQKSAPPADAAIILSLEAVFAALGGWLFLDERLASLQLLGCALMLAAMLLAQARSFISASGT